jgi:DNA-directed RNA polymerase subunit RPC12/RpoP
VAKNMKCESCGAEISFDPRMQVLRCEFCGSTYMAEVPTPTTAAAKPWQADEIIIPFSLTEGQANQHFSGWVKKGLFKPNDLGVLLQRAPLKNFYIPTWNYAFEASTNWSGQKRYTRTVSETNSSGQRTSRTIEEWEYRSGTHHDYYNLFIAASSGLTNTEVDKLAPFPLEDAVPFSSDYFAGTQAEVPHKSPDQAWTEAQQVAQAQEQQAVNREIDRINSMNTQFFNETHRLAYVPIFISGYNYKQKYYRVLINGRTGEVQGKKPVSVIKVLIAIGIAVALIAAAIILFSVYGKH